MYSSVLFLVFNRPDVTKRVFDAIRQARPPKLYIAADGPRKDRVGEAEQCKAVQDIVSKVDWPCEVSRLIRQDNLGCKIAVSSAIDWFFSQESEGIILEDDCLPHPDFFPYCDELLERYRDDERVGLISGTSFGDLRAESLLKGNEDYLFTRYPSIWGWASWRRVWVDYDVNIVLWNEYSFDISMLVPSLRVRKKITQFFNLVSSRKIDTWDYQVSFLLWITSRLSIAPRFNLIENIGFGPQATHTKYADRVNNDRCKMGLGYLDFPLRAPKIMTPNYKYQLRLENYATRTIFAKLINRIASSLVKRL